MRLCQPYFRALSRSFVAVGLLSGVMAALWLVATIALAQLIDGQSASRPLPDLLPLLAVMLIASGGALIVQLARDTLLNRRRIWLEHGLAEVVLAHELWRGSDLRHRNRSLAAVDAIAHFTGSPAAKALSEAPWVMAIVGGLWTLDMDLAAVASIAMLVALALALSGSRLNRRARQFDSTLTAIATGQDLLHTARLDTGLSMDQARHLASRWEAIQRNHVVTRYAAAQAQSRITVVIAILILASTVAMAALAVTTPHGLSKGGLVAACLTGFGTLLSMSRWVVDAPKVATARSAQRQLVTLRVARTRSGETHRAPIAAPDLRAPLAGALFATAAAVAGLTLAVNYWQLPILTIVRDTFAVHQVAAVSTLAGAPVSAAPAPSAVVPSLSQKAVPKGLS